MSGSENAARVSSFKAPVSFHNEQLILVDDQDRTVGFSSKRDAHRGGGQLHRAFSVFLFDGQRRLLVHRRSEQKPLWPRYWTNSCCSHPRRGENLAAAVHRRIREELGVKAVATHVYDFEYHARYLDLGSEYERCHVFLAQAADSLSINVHEDEIMEWRWLELAEVDALVAERASEVTPWFALEWQALRGIHAQQLNGYLQTLETPRSVA